MYKGQYLYTSSITKLVSTYSAQVGTDSPVLLGAHGQQAKDCRLLTTEPAVQYVLCEYAVPVQKCGKRLAKVVEKVGKMLEKLTKIGKDLIKLNKLGIGWKIMTAMGNGLKNFEMYEKV
jgi:hypothetical protein